MKFKHLLSLSAFAAMSVCAMAQPAGDGTPEKPYQIKTADDLIWFSEQIIEETYPASGNGNMQYVGKQQDACAVLCNDIDMDMRDFIGIGYLGPKYLPDNSPSKGRTSELSYNGVFDGQNHTISNLSLFYPDKTKRQGLFVYVGDGAVVKNVFLKDVTALLVAGDGAFCAYNEGTIENCYVTGVVYDAGFGEGEAIGGFVGDNANIVKGCVSGVTFKYDAEYYGMTFESDYAVGTFAGTGMGSVIDCVSVKGAEAEPFVFFDPAPQSGQRPNPNHKIEEATVATVAEAEAIIAERMSSATPVSGIRADKFLNGDDRCTVYSISGSVVYSGAANGMKVAKPGIYVVKVGGATRKMYVK